jgi:hypothetical protein
MILPSMQKYTHIIEKLPRDGNITSNDLFKPQLLLKQFFKPLLKIILVINYMGLGHN